MTKPKERDGVTKYHVYRRVSASYIYLTKTLIKNIYQSRFRWIYFKLSVLMTLRLSVARASWVGFVVVGVGTSGARMSAHQTQAS